MSNKNITILLVLVIGSMGLLFTINLTNIYGQKTPQRFLSLNDIYGMAVEHKGKQYTLNFEQQNNVANILNRSVKIENINEPNKATTSFDYDSLIIYRFGKEAIKIKPVGFINLQILLLAPEFNPKGLLRETGPGELNPLLSQTYDPI